MKYDKEYWNRRFSNAAKVAFFVTAGFLAGNNKVQANVSDNVYAKKSSKENVITAEGSFRFSAKENMIVDRTEIRYEASFGQKKIGSHGDVLLFCQVETFENSETKMNAFVGVKRGFDGKIFSLSGAEKEIAGVYEHEQGSEIVIDRRRARKRIVPENIEEIARNIYQKQLQKFGYGVEEAKELSGAIAEKFYGLGDKSVEVTGQMKKESISYSSDNLTKVEKLRKRLKKNQQDIQNDFRKAQKLVKGFQKGKVDVFSVFEQMKER